MTIAICSIVVALFTEGMLGVNAANAAEMLTAYTYHDYPPFVFKSGAGLGQDMVEKLNREGKGKVEYQLKVLSRPELDQLMTKPDFRGVVLWVSPVWFKVDNSNTTIWSRPLLRDAQVIISRKAKPVAFVASDSLMGKRFGGVRGQHYVGIDELIAEGRIQREDGVDERAILGMLDAGKVDAIALPQSVTNLLVQEAGLAERVYVAPLPLNTYFRHMLFRNVPKAAIASVQKVLATLPQNAQWQAKLANYRLEDAENSTRTLVRLCFNHYPPYVMGDEAHPSDATGIKVDIAKYVFGELKYPVSIITLPFKRCLHEVELGNMDGALPLTKNAERARYMKFSEPANPQSMVFVYKKSRFPTGLHWRKIDELTSYKLLLNLGSSIGGELDAAFEAVAPILRGVNLDSVLLMLDAERADFSAMDKFTAQYVINKLGLADSLTVSETAINNNPVYFGFSKSSSVVSMLPQINQILGRMNRDGTMNAIMQRHLGAATRDPQLPPR